MLDPFVKRFKIRESDGRTLLENKISELCRLVIKTNKEVIVSSESSPKKSKYYNHPIIKWLYVVPKYPCSLSDLNFRNLKDFDGYSNHCPVIIAPLTATVLGAQIIEIHITLDKSKNFIDNNVSFDYNEIVELTKLIRHFEQIKI